MKKLLWIAVIILGMNTVKAQEKNTSLIAGYTSVTLKEKLEYSGGNEDFENDAKGFFIGLTHQFYINETTSFVPGVIYTNVKGDGNDESETFIQIPLFFKYQISEKFSITGGPKLEYYTDAVDELDDYINDLALSLGIGVEINLAQSLALIANYSFQVTNSYNSDAKDDFGYDELSAKHSFFNVGLAYKF